MWEVGDEVGKKSGLRRSQVLQVIRCKGDGGVTGSDVLMWPG